MENKKTKTIKIKMKKFTSIDSNYLRQRKVIANDIGRQDLFEIVDQFGLYAGAQTITKSIGIYEIIKKTLNVPGHILEFGSWNGSNLLLMAKLLSVIQPNTIKKVFGFDSFEGLKTFAKEDGKFGNNGDYQGNREILEKFITLYGFENFVHLIVGDALKTIDEFKKKNRHILISLAYIDFDLYEPCKKALNFVHNQLSVGGYIVFDEAYTEEWPGEGIAMNEFLEQNQGHYQPEIVPFVRQPTVLLKKVK